MRETLAMAVCGGLLLAALKFIEYQHFVRSWSTELFGAAIAVIFTLIGLWAGRKILRPREIEVFIEREPLPAGLPFEPDRSKVETLGITKRELEILGLIAEGLSNREIGERLFVSEHTVKSHSSRLFEKLQASRRTQAVQRAKELGILA